MAKNLILLLIGLIISNKILVADIGDILFKTKLDGISHITALAIKSADEIWVADKEKDSLYLINFQSNKILKKLPAPSFRITGMGYKDGRLWLCDKFRNKVYCINTNDGIIENSWEFAGKSPNALTVTDKGIWVLEERKNLYLLQELDGTIIKKFDVSGGSGLGYDGKYLWIANRMRDEIYQFSSRYGEIINIIPAPDKHISALAVHNNSIICYGYQNKELMKISIKPEKDFYILNNKKLRCDFICKVHSQGNGNIQEGHIYIAVPHSLPNQEIIGDIQFSDKNMKFVYDQWGQKIADFEFQENEFQASMTVNVNLKRVRYFIVPEKCKNIADIPEDTIKKYTQEGSKLFKDDKLIQQIAEKIKKESKENNENLFWLYRRIYRYVRENVDYEYAGGWEIAPVILERGTGSCSEFSFSFLAIAHAIGVPSRFQGSIRVRGDDASTDDVFHRWVEVYLPPYGWLPIDPSGGDSESLRWQAKNFGELDEKSFITTIGCGDSKYLNWSYNYNTDIKYKGNLVIEIESYGEWQPWDENSK